LEAFGALSLIVVLLNQGKLRNAPRHRVTRAAACCALGALLLFSLYLALYGYCVVSVAPHSPVYFPIVACPSLQGEIDGLGGSRASLIIKWGSDQVTEIIRECPEPYLVLTTGLLLIIYLPAFVALISALGIAAAATRAEPT
jgi:hypothetical protein